MSLKLFRSTGYSSILAPGETRLALHPGWLILAISAWIGFACNLPLWRELRSPGPGLGQALLTGAFIMAASATLLSLLGWRRTLKPAATLLLLLAALATCRIWSQAAPAGHLLDQGLRSLIVAPGTSFLRWQVPALLVGLGLLPMLWLWQVQVRRLPGPRQLACNAIGSALGLAALAASGWPLWGRAA